MGRATQEAGGPLLHSLIPPGMSYDAATGAWTFSGDATVTGNLATTGGRTVKLRTITETTTLDGTDHHIVCNSGSALTVNLPAVASNTGREYIIKNKGAGVVTVDANASELIDNATTAALNQWQSLHLVCDGAIWAIV